jgi:hypothetical protein
MKRLIAEIKDSPLPSEAPDLPARIPAMAR